MLAQRRRECRRRIEIGEPLGEVDRVVRLRQGRMEDDTVFSDNPVEMASRWVAAGGRRLHLVDLNGAFVGEPVNGAVIRAIAETYPEMPIQVGGGIRDEATIEAYLAAGVIEEQREAYLQGIFGPKLLALLPDAAREAVRALPSSGTGALKVTPCTASYPAQTASTSGVTISR